MVVVLRVAHEVIAGRQVLNLDTGAGGVDSFALCTVFHRCIHASDFSVAAAHGGGRDTDQAVRRFLRGFADAPRCGHGLSAAVRPFAGLGCDANGVIARVRGGVAGDVHCGGIIAAHGCGMLGAIVGVGSGDTDAGLGGIGRRRWCILLEDCLDLYIAVRHGELVVHDCHAAADDLPLLEVVALVWCGGQSDLRTGRSLCKRCGSRSAALCGHGDGILGGRGLGYRNRQLLRIAVRAVFCLDGEAGSSRCGGRAADLAGGFFQRQALGQLATNAPCDRLGAGGNQGLAVRLAHLAIRQAGRGDAGRGGSVFADGEIVLRLAAVVPRAVQRHLGGFCRVKARVVRFEGVGMDVVGIDGGVVRVLRKLLRFVLARLMGKPRQLLFAAV